MNAVPAVVLFIGLGAFGALAWVARHVMALERPVDVGAIAVVAVLAGFGSFCLYIAWRVFQTKEVGPADAPPAGAVGPRRLGVSQACSSAGVVLLVASAVIPEHWYPVAFLFAGLALLCVSHVLTPCEERLEKLRKARASLRQL